MKRLITFIIIVITISLTLVGCASEEERARAMEFEEIARPILEKYVDKNFNSLDNINISSIDDIYEATGLFELSATSLVKATVEYRVEVDGEAQDRKFELIYDTDNQRMYTNYESDRLINKLGDTLSIENGLIEIGFKHRDMQDIDAINDSYYKVDVENYSFNSVDIQNGDYTLFAILSLPIEVSLTTVYETMDLIGNSDYLVEVLFGEGYIDSYPHSKYSYIEDEIGDSSSIDTDGAVLILENKSGTKTEELHEYSKIDIEDGYILYDSSICTLSLRESTTELGSSHSESSTSDYNIYIRSNTSINENLKFKVVSDKYKNVIYGYQDNFSTYTDEMTSMSLFNFSSEFYTEIVLDDTHNEHNLTMALYS